MELTIIFLFLLLLMCISWLFISLAFYSLPIIIAYIRKHNNIFPIAILTIFLGWTFAGWLAALLWSLNSDTRDEDND